MTYPVSCTPRLEVSNPQSEFLMIGLKAENVASCGGNTESLKRGRIQAAVNALRKAIKIFKNA